MKKTLCFRLLTIGLVFVLHFYPYLAKGQTPSIDSGRMERDISIMEKVLNELFSNQDKNAFSFGKFSPSDRSAQGSFVPGYGVIFITPSYSGSLLASKKLLDAKVMTLNNQIYTLKSQAYTNQAYTYTISPEAAPQKGAPGQGVTMGVAKATEKEKAKPAKPAKDKTGKEVQVTQESDANDLRQAQIDRVIKNMKEFLVNYADAVGQLLPNNHILVIYNENARNSNKGRFYVSDDGEELSVQSMPKISAEVKREDLSNYRAGKMDRKELEKRIQINQQTEGKETYSEYKVFAGILESLFPVSQEVSYRVSNISYHYLPSFGVIYLVDMNLRNEYPFTKLARSIDKPSPKDSQNEKADSAQIQMKEEAYRQFQRDIRASLLDYGRTLRNLSADQMILLTVSVPTCEGCKVPERVNVSVKKSVLDAYEQNQLDRNKALESINIGAVESLK